MAQVQQQGGAASDNIAALATELIQYIGAAETRYIEGVDAGNTPLSKNARQAALVSEVADKIRFLIHGNTPVSGTGIHPDVPPDTPPFNPASPPAHRK